MNNWPIRLALVANAAVAAYLVYAFTAPVTGNEVAVFAAGALVLTYVGLAALHVPVHQQARARKVAISAMLIEAAYGALFVLAKQSPELFAPPLSLWASIPLALLHGSAFSVLAYFISLFVLHQDAAPAGPFDELLVELRIITRDLRAQADALDLNRVDTVMRVLIDHAEGRALPAPRIVEAREGAAPIAAVRYVCPHCGAAVRNQQAHASAVGKGYCPECKPSRG